MKNISIFSILFTTSLIVSCEVGMEKNITLEVENKQFEIPEALVKNYSSTLKYLSEESSDQIIPLETNSAKSIEELITFLKISEQHSNLRNNDLLDALDSAVATSDPVSFLHDANYLDIPVAAAWAARTIANDEKLYRSEVIQKLEPNHLKQIVERYHALLHSKQDHFNKLVLNSSDKFSIQDYLYCKPAVIKEQQSHPTSILMEYMHLDSLEGLHNIPHIQSIKTLGLYFNKFETFTFNTSENLQNLTSLLLGNNALKKLYPYNFKQLPQLGVLYLHNNKLEEIPDDSFNGLNKLEWLYLNDNPVKILNQNSFNGLSSLQQLILSAKAVTCVPTGLFAHLPTLKSFSCDNDLIRAQAKKEVSQFS